MRSQSPDDKINLFQFLLECKRAASYLLLKWKLLVSLGILGGGIGLLYASIQKPVYTAALTFALEQENNNRFSGALSLASQLGLDVGVQGGSVFEGSNLIEFFKSRKMVEKTLLSPVQVDGRQLSFAQLFIETMGWQEQWKKTESLKEENFSINAVRSKFTRAQDSVLGIIYSILTENGLSIKQKEKDIEIVTIELKSSNEIFAKRFVETLAINVSDFYIWTKNQKARDNLDILEQQVDSIRSELNSSITGVAASNDNTFNLNPALNIRRVPSSKRQVDVQANSTMLVELIKQTELARVTLRKQTPLIQIIDQPVLPLKKEKMGRFKGIVLFGFLTGIITCILLLIRRYFRNYNEHLRTDV